MLAGAVGLAALVLYAWSILRQGTTASPVSWAIWAAVPAVVYAAGRTDAAGVTLWLPLAELAGTVLVFALSLRYGGGWRPEPWEWVLLGAVAVALAGWWLTRLAAVAIVLPSLADLAGTVPTAVRDYADPSREPPLARLSWLGLVAAGVLGLAGGPGGVLRFYPACLVLAGAVVTGAWLAGTLARPGGGRLAVTGGGALACVAAIAISGLVIWRLVSAPPMAGDTAGPAPAGRPPASQPAAVVVPVRLRHHARTVPRPVLAELPVPAVASVPPTLPAPSPHGQPPPAPSPQPSPSSAPPSPSPSPSPLPSLTVSPTPSPTPTPTPSPTPSATPTATPTPTASQTYI